MSKSYPHILCLFEKYGFLLVLLYYFGVLTPNLVSKASIMETDFTSMVASESGSNSFKQFFLLLMFVLYIFLAFKRVHSLSYKILISNLLPAIYFLLVLIGLCLISVLWSAEPLLTIKRLVAQCLIIYVLASSLLFSTLHSNNFNNIRLLLISSLFFVFLSLILGVGVDTQGDLSGYQDTKNTMGSTLAVIFILFCTMRNANSDIIIDVALLAIVFVLLIFTGSKTGMILTVLFMVLTWLPHHIIRLFIALLGISFVVVFMLAPIYTYISGDTLQSAGAWNIANVVGPDFFTGRGLIWSSVYYQLEYFDKLTFGYGYGAFFGTQEIPYFFDIDDSFLRFINSAHNGYIEMLSQLGIFGVVLIGFIIVNFCFLRSPYLLSAAFFILVYNFTESTFLRNENIIWIMTILVFLYDPISNLSEKNTHKPKNSTHEPEPKTV